MKVFIDTSGFYAYACGVDAGHLPVREVMHWLASEKAAIITTSYVVSETMGLIQKRLGFKVLADFVDTVLPVVDVYWINQGEHLAGWQLMLGRPRRGLTIVDATGMIVMHREKISVCVALDPEFAHEGFRVLPSA